MAKNTWHYLPAPIVPKQQIPQPCPEVQPSWSFRTTRPETLLFLVERRWNAHIQQGQSKHSFRALYRWIYILINCNDTNNAATHLKYLVAYIFMSKIIGYLLCNFYVKISILQGPQYVSSY